MIHVTQGHRNGIGLEVFLKSFSLLSAKNQKMFVLHCIKSDLEKYLNNMNYTYQYSEAAIKYESSILNLKFCEKSNTPNSTISMLSALGSLKSKDILITLPTTKDELFLNNEPTFGHTDFLKRYFHKDDVSMTFITPSISVLLITDHIPLRDVADTIDTKLIVSKLSHVLDVHEYSEVLLSGINPHCGENGLLGNEDFVIHEAITILAKRYSKVKFSGPFAGDTLTFQHTNNSQLFVYMYHDQGLGVFKSQNDTLGINRTFGLPITRLSVDHGTAFDLTFTGKADYYGCHYVLKYALNMQ